jgi:pimeloyl-ACP methyl ester carboxylesterase
VSVWYDVHGEGPAVALVHAGVADSRMWDPQLGSFPRSHKVLRVDLPGFGRSPLETDPVSYRGAVREALDAARIDRAALVGVSLGGAASLELALESPDRVSALVLVGSGLDGHDWSEQVESPIGSSRRSRKRPGRRSRALLIFRTSSDRTSSTGSS